MSKERTARMDFALNGSEVQIEGISYVIHWDMDIEEVVVEFEKRLRKCFNGETAHKITRIQGNSFGCSFYSQSGHEEIHYRDVIAYVRELHTTVGFPIDMRVLNLVTYTPLLPLENTEDTP